MGSLFQEIKRRKVFRVATIYAVVAWVLIQVAETIAPLMNLPDCESTILIPVPPADKPAIEALLSDRCERKSARDGNLVIVDVRMTITAAHETQP